MTSNADICRIFKKIAEDTARLLRNYFGIDKYNEIIGRGVAGDVSRLIDVIAEEYVLDRVEETGFIAWVVGEERGRRELGENPDIIVLLDPLDGSLNYSLKIPFASVSLAVYHGLTSIVNPVYGVVYNIFTKDVIEICGGRVYFNNTEMTSRLNTGLELVSIYTENPLHLSILKKVLEENNIHVKTRTMGSASIEAAYAAVGFIGHFIHLTGRIRNTDIAVALAIANKLGAGIYTYPFINEIRVDIVEPIKKVVIADRNSPVWSVISDL